MNRIGMWFYLSCKRQMKRPFFLLLLLLLPAGMWMFHRTEQKSTDRLPIALYTSGDAWNEEVAKRLMEKDGSFEFYLCGSEEALSKDVAAKRGECGYVFPAGLKEKLDAGTYRRSITMVTSPSTAAAKLASETVFAGMFEVYARELLARYAKDGEAFKGAAETEEEKERVWAELEPLYDKYLEDGSTFAFSYALADGKTVETDSVKAVFPVRGIAAVFIFVMSLAAAVTTAEDERRGLFTAARGRRKEAFMFAELLAPVALACCSAFLCLAVTGEAERAGAEMISLLLYGLFTTVFSYVLLLVIKNPLVLSGLIPFFIIASLTACPVFADLSAFVPVLTALRRLLPPFYYLMM